MGVESVGGCCCCLFASLLACAFSNGPHPHMHPHHQSMVLFWRFRFLKNTARGSKIAIRGGKRKKKGSAGVWTASRECGSFATLRLRLSKGSLVFGGGRGVRVVCFGDTGAGVLFAFYLGPIWELVISLTLRSSVLAQCWDWCGLKVWAW